MKICAVSDLHGRFPTIPECDVLLIAGDLCADFGHPGIPNIMRERQMAWLDTDYRAWEASVPAKHILATPGNHDWINAVPEGLKTRLFIDEGCEVYDELTDQQRKFWFTPWIEPIWDWNYMLERGPRKARFEMIPHGLDVLVSHSPIHNVCDAAYDGEHCGCPELRRIVQDRKPAHVCYGHIHEAQRHGGPHHMLGKTATHCCSMWGENWKPVEFDLW